MNVYLGCRLNQAEIEAMAAGFQQRGHHLAASPGAADLLVLNTCAVTGEAARDSRQRLRSLHVAAQPRGIERRWVRLIPVSSAASSAAR